MVRVTVGSRQPPGAVLAIWQELVGFALSPASAGRFLARPELTVLCRYHEDRLRAAGAGLHQRSGRLLLARWARECAWDGGGSVALGWVPLALNDLDAVTVARDLLAAAVASVRSEQDRSVLAQRLGLDGDAAMTLAEVGAGLQLTSERVRRLQARALDQMCRRQAPPSAGNYAGEVIAGVISQAVAEGAGPAAALLTLAEAACPGTADGFAVQVLARLAGHDHYTSRHLAAEAMTLRAVHRTALADERHQAEQAEQAAERLDRMLQQAEWPGSQSPAPPRWSIRPQREADGDRAGSWPSAKLAREVGYDSVAELSLIRVLDRAPQVLWFCEQPAAIGYAFDGRHRTYYPDLLAVTDDGRCVLVEVKALPEMPLSVNQAKAAAARGFCARHGWGYLLTDANGRTLHDLAALDVPEPAAAGFARALGAAGTMTWREVKAQRRQHRLSAVQVSALAVQRGWEIRLGPYRISERVSTALTG